MSRPEGVLINEGVQAAVVRDLQTKVLRDGKWSHIGLLIITAVSLVAIFSPNWTLQLATRLILCLFPLAFVLTTVTSIWQAKQRIRAVVTRMMPVGSRVHAYVNGAFLVHTAACGTSNFRTTLYTKIALTEHSVFLLSATSVTTAIPRRAFNASDLEILRERIESAPARASE